MPSSTASCTQRTASPSTARPCANHQKNPPSVASLTPTTPSEPLKPSMGAAVRDHRNAVRDRSESLSAINRNTCPQSPESAQVDLTFLDAVLHLAAGAVDFFVEMAAIVFGRRRDNEARIGFALGPLGLGDDAPLAAPALSGPPGKILELARRPASVPALLSRRRQFDRNGVD